MEEEVPLPPTDEEVAGAVSCLAGAFQSLCELDKDMLSKVGQGRLARMKRKIFNAMIYYCEILPEPEKKPKPDENEDVASDEED